MKVFYNYLVLENQCRNIEGRGNRNDTIYVSRSHFLDSRLHEVVGAAEWNGCAVSIIESTRQLS